MCATNSTITSSTWHVSYKVTNTGKVLAVYLLVDYVRIWAKKMKSKISRNCAKKVSYSHGTDCTRVDSNPYGKKQGYFKCFATINYKRLYSKKYMELFMKQR